MSRETRTFRPLLLPTRHPAAAISLVLGVTAVVGWVLGWPMGFDDAVYRAGAWAVLHGKPLYEPLATLPDWSQVRQLPFTYPPVAALLFTPLTLLPLQLAWGVMAVASTLALAFVVRTPLGVGKARWTPAAALTLVGAFALEPVWRTFSLGQVNLLLLALVVADALLLPRTRWGGTLIGLAAAVKLTPLVFVAHLLVTGRRADAARAVGVFVGLNLLGALLLPADTVSYVTGGMTGGDDATGNAWGGNQSLNGLVQRLTGQASWAFAVAATAACVCVVVALLLARRLHRRGEALGALLVTGCAGALASPISWSHHWVFVVPLAALLVRQARRSSARGPRLLLGALVAVFSGWSLFVVPIGEQRELTWNPLQMLLGNAYVLVGVAALALLAWRLLRPGAEPAPALPALSAVRISLPGARPPATGQPASRSVSRRP
ncbi:glycosyltransferase 87 family protein [Streptacidiphilus anmyonensis]|uniref:glycosyltransferase 87 family protein n=1 Tax=Streptacidiphilus anmyonensis TaxID=405782 RepID=UPI0005A972FE|nr:glycosyltransferase 87 family protein [Streptacidiphilus anmyonensis]